MFGTYLILARYSPNPHLFLLVTFGILETSVGCNVSNVYCDFCVINNIMCQSNNNVFTHIHIQLLTFFCFEIMGNIWLHFCARKERRKFFFDAFSMFLQPTFFFFYINLFWVITSVYQPLETSVSLFEVQAKYNSTAQVESLRRRTIPDKQLAFSSCYTLMLKTTAFRSLHGISLISACYEMRHSPYSPR